MSVYDPALIGWDVGDWCSRYVHFGEGKAIAIVDEVTRANPEGRNKGFERQIDQLQSAKARIQA